MFWNVSLSMCCPLYWIECPNLYGVRALRFCPSQWRGGLVYEGMDKGSFDDVTFLILRRHQINLSLFLLTIYGPSSSSSTSSSPSASSQRKSAFQQPAKGVGWYVDQLWSRRNWFFSAEVLFLQCAKRWKRHIVTLFDFQERLSLNPGSHCGFVAREPSVTTQAL